VRTVHLGALLALFAALVVALAFAAKPPRTKPIDAPPQQFSADRALLDIRALTSTGLSHHVDYRSDHARAREVVVRRLRELGLAPIVQEGTGCIDEQRTRCAPVQNVIARLGDGPAIMLAAHYDSARGGPGASDDGAGVSTILEIVRAIRDEPRNRSLVLLFTDGEELGLLGARLFVREHPWARDVSVVLNFEARGTSGQTAMFETSTGSGWLVDLYARAVDRPVASSVIYTLYKALPNDTDMTVFKAAGMQGLNFAFADEVWNYHTQADDVAHLDPRSLQHMGDQGLATTRALLALREISPPASREAVWFEVFTLGLVRYRAWFAIALALLQALVFGFATVRAVRRELTTVRAIVAGFGRFCAMLFASVLAGFVVHSLIVLISGRERPGWFSPMPSWLALVAVAVAASSASMVVWRGRDDEVSIHTNIRGLIVGVLIPWSALSLLLGFKAPGASYLFAWPAFVASVALLVMRRDDGPGRTSVAIGLGAFVAAFLWFPLLRVLLVMVGAEVNFVTTIPVAMVVSLVMPIQRGISGRSKWVLPLSGTVVTILAMAVAVMR